MTISNCLNCNSPLSGDFCSHCGQKVVDPKLSFWQLLSLFFSSTFNYDGRLIRSIKLLLFHPAALTHAYIKGKRKSFVNPVQFYLFSSAIYFLIANLTPAESLIQINTTSGRSVNQEQQVELTFENFEGFLAHQQTLRPEERKNNLELLFLERFYDLKEDYPNTKALLSAIAEKIFSKVPQLLLVTLPFLAFLSRVILIRRKNLWYIDHLIFVLHLATSLFLVMTSSHLLNFAAKALDVIALSWASSALFLAWIGYYLISLKRFFSKTWGASIFYFLTLNTLFGITFSIAFLLLIALSILQL